MEPPLLKNTIVDNYRKKSKKDGFRVNAHMLRHTYATYTLHAFRERRFKGDALLYLRERLGHSSIETTMIYLHLLDEIDSDLITKYDKEIDKMYEVCS